MTTEIRYASLISKLRAMTRNINTIIEFNKLCQQSDDEDCFRDSYRYCGTLKPPTLPPDMGSGFGSGDMNDTETLNMTTNVFYGTPAMTTTEQTENTDQDGFDNELGDEMAPTPPPKPVFTLAPVTVDNKPPVQDGFDNSIPSYKGPEKPAIPPNTKPSKPVQQTVPTMSYTSKPDDGVIVDTMTTSTTADGNPEGSNKVTSASTEGFIQVRDKMIPTISSSAPLHISRILTSLLISCLCIFISLC